MQAKRGVGPMGLMDQYSYTRIFVADATRIRRCQMTVISPYMPLIGSMTCSSMLERITGPVVTNF